MALSLNELSSAEIVAHRGSSYEAPENTVASATLAWEQKADAVEMDVFLTKDGKIVVLHDEDTKRTTGVAGKVESLTVAELQRLDAGSWKNARYAGERIPTLDELLATGGAKKRFFIEIKHGAEVMPELLACIQRAGLLPSQVVIISSNLDALKASKAALPEIKALLICAYRKKLGRYPDLDALLREAQAAGLDGLDLNYRFPIDAGFMKKVKAAGMGLWVWTLDDATIAKKLIAAGIDGVTTNRPGWMREQLAE